MAVPPLSAMLAIITSPATTPVGLLMVSVVPLAVLAVVALPRWTIFGVAVGVGVGVGEGDAGGVGLGVGGVPGIVK